MDRWIELLEELWDAIQVIALGIIQFVKNIAAFFKTPKRLQQLQENKNIIAASIKKNLENGDYRVVNCLFDTSTNKVVDMQEDIIGMEAAQIDEETAAAFNQKNMIILR